MMKCKFTETKKALPENFGEGLLPFKIMFFPIRLMSQWHAPGSLYL